MPRCGIPRPPAVPGRGRIRFTPERHTPMCASAIVLVALFQETPLPPLLKPDAGLFIWTVIIFGAVLFILWKYAWVPIGKALKQRESTIDASIRRAELALEQARQIAADNERQRREAEVEAQRILRGAREASERLRAEEREKTQEQVQHMLDQARADIEQEKQNALAELRAEVADLAIQAAEKVLNTNLDASTNRKIVSDFIDGLPRN